MKLHNMLPFRRALWLAIATGAALANAQDALFQTYCSTQNTGSDYNAVTNIWQSNGACHDSCSGYAFAVVQYQQCWCSNYVPASQASVSSDCNQSCPGYPDEKCGNSDSGYYGYIALGPQPSGTAGATGAVSSTSAPPSSSSPPQSSSEAPETMTTTTPSTTTHKTTTSTPPPTTEAPATPVTSIILTTISGDIVTQTVTSTPVVVPNSHADSMPVEQQKSGLGAGAIAGIVVGVIAGLSILALAAFLLLRRRKNRDVDNTESGQPGSKRNMTRNVSVLSKAGLLSRAHPSMSERDHDDSYGPTGSNSVRHSIMFGGLDGVSPTSPLDSSHSGGSASGSRRLSKPMVYDQRLNPSALFANQEANGSRISMQDQQDYSRPLGVMNPDPRPSFESRNSEIRH